MEKSDDEDEKWDQLDAKEWERIKTSRRTDGYREGLDAGKESSRQEGFNNGYPVGLNIVQSTGKLKGKIWAIMKLIESKNDEVMEADKTEAVRILSYSIEKLKEMEKKCVTDIYDKNDIATDAQNTVTEENLNTIVNACKSELVKLNLTVFIKALDE